MAALGKDLLNYSSGSLWSVMIIKMVMISMLESIRFCLINYNAKNRTSNIIFFSKPTRNEIEWNLTLYNVINYFIFRKCYWYQVMHTSPRLSSILTRSVWSWLRLFRGCPRSWSWRCLSTSRSPTCWWWWRVAGWSSSSAPPVSPLPETLPLCPV